MKKGQRRTKQQRIEWATYDWTDSQTGEIISCKIKVIITDA